MEGPQQRKQFYRARLEEVRSLTRSLQRLLDRMDALRGLLKRFL
jgi:hypothetical protein